jgi:hypothetical protein
MGQRHEFYTTTTTTTTNVCDSDQDRTPNPLYTDE